MAKHTVNFTVEHGLCISCGVCKGICPKDCIRWEWHQGMYVPKINPETCIECGICGQVCPGIKMEFTPAETVEESMIGNALECYNAWSKDQEKRHCSASGGVLSTLIPILLDKGCYDGVFCLDSYDYREQLRSRYKTSQDFSDNWSANKTPKSRYLPVSHEEAVAYIRRHPKSKMIFIGTSCAIHGLSNVIEQLRRDREQYLLIGLFCDKVFSYNVISYYQQEKFCGERELTELHFKNKESGGWPGNMKFHFSDGSSRYHGSENRAGMKQYFMPERCLYCIDKLNIKADISIGDNYTGINESPLGSNSVILRTKQGLAAWLAADGQIEAHAISIEDIGKAQALSWRAENMQYALCKQRQVPGVGLNTGISVEENPVVMAKYNQMLLRLTAGKVYPDNPAELTKQIKKANHVPLKKKLRRILSKAYHKLVK